MTDWVVRRWARYGHERLYAETPGGTSLGYLDVQTGRFHTDDLSNMPLLQQAISDHLAARQASAGSTPASNLHDGATPLHDGQPADIPTPATPAVPHWEDISATRAGAAARERAIAEREAAPFRTTVARLLGVKTGERAWRIGADGEEAVAAQLARLGPAWRVLHAVRVGDRGTDIDHVVIGPGGVFTVNAKHRPRTKVWVGGDTFIVGGHRVDYVRNSRHEARRAAKLLTEHAGFAVAVIGVIAVVGAHEGFVVKEQPRDGAVHVVQRKRISHYLLSLPPRLTAREIDAIYDIARRSTTWRRDDERASGVASATSTPQATQTAPPSLTDETFAPSSPPQWSADPTGKHQHRYWDGTRWTEHVSDHGIAAIDPM